jgi:hypothetical protein
LWSWAWLQALLVGLLSVLCALVVVTVAFAVLARSSFLTSHFKTMLAMLWPDPDHEKTVSGLLGFCVFIAAPLYFGYRMGRWCDARGGINSSRFFVRLLSWLDGTAGLLFQTASALFSQTSYQFIFFGFVAWLLARWEVPYANWVLWACVAAFAYVVTQPIVKALRSWLEKPVQSPVHGDAHKAPDDELRRKGLMS